MEEDQYACRTYENFTRGLTRPRIPECLLPVNERQRPRSLLGDECLDTPTGGVLDPSIDNMLNKTYGHEDNARSHREVMSGGQTYTPSRQKATPPASTPLRSTFKKSNVRPPGAESKNNSVCFTRSSSGARGTPTPNRSASTRPVTSPGQSRGSPFGEGCPDDYGGDDSCLLDPFKGSVNPGMLEWLLNKFWARQQQHDEGPCPLDEQGFNTKNNKKSPRSAGRRGGSCFESAKSKTNDGTPFQEIDDLWNPEKFIRWKCVDKWDQYKESMWKQLIYSKLDCPESYLRDVKKMMEDAFNALDSPGGECVAFRMIYGILKRNEDMYLNEYLDHFTDEQFIQLVVALNRFFHQDKDKRKAFLDNPPPNFIEKVMMKETLGIIDPGAPFSDIARRFWELLLDWYTAKVTQQKKPTQRGRQMGGCGPSPAPSSTRTTMSSITGSTSNDSVLLGSCGVGPNPFV